MFSVPVFKAQSVTAEGSYDITTAASTPDQTKDLSAVIGIGDAYIYFSPDGAKLFASTGTAYRFSLSTPWDITTASYDSNTGSLAGSKGFWFSADGTIVFSVDNGSTIYSQALNAAWDLTTLQSSNSATLGSGKYRGIALSVTGLIGAMYDDNTKTIVDFDLSTAWDITSASLSGHSFGVTGNEAFAGSYDGKHFYSGKASIEQDDLSTAWDLTSQTDVGSNDLDAANNKGIFIGDDGSSFYAVSSGIVQQYYLT